MLNFGYFFLNNVFKKFKGTRIGSKLTQTHL